MIKEDPYQTGIVRVLQDLHDRLGNYDPPLMSAELNDSGSIFGKVYFYFLSFPPCAFHMSRMNISHTHTHMYNTHCRLQGYLHLPIIITIIIITPSKDYIYLEMLVPERQC